MFQKLLFFWDSINLDPAVALVWNGNIAEKPFVYFFQNNLFLEISKRSSVQKVLRLKQEAKFETAVSSWYDSSSYTTRAIRIS